MIKQNTDLENALDGLIHAIQYADDIGEKQLSFKIAGMYQRLAQASPDEHWENVEGMEFKEVLDMMEDDRVSAQEAMQRNPNDERERYD